jgi:hypothetical protein
MTLSVAFQHCVVLCVQFVFDAGLWFLAEAPRYSVSSYDLNDMLDIYIYIYIYIYIARHNLLQQYDKIQYYLLDIYRSLPVYLITPLVTQII